MLLFLWKHYVLKENYFITYQCLSSLDMQTLYGNLLNKSKKLIDNSQ